MDMYDVTVVGGGIAGSVAARFSAEHGFKTLLIERFKTPRNKPCSGIQFPYLEKLIGERIPSEVLCNNELFKVEMITPSGKVIKGRMKMLNFWRSTLDSWLNSLAVQAGAHFCDETRFGDFHEEVNCITVETTGKAGETKFRTRYLIGADGLNSAIRRRLQPQDFKRKSLGAAINYYYDGDAKLDPNTLYMFYHRQFCPLMFAWVYMKDDQWVVGTGADRDLMTYAKRFLSYIQERYALHGQMVRKEGFSSPMENRVYLGHGNVLITGDAAGLIDLYRGLGMDNAALSGRLAVKAIVGSEKIGCPAIGPYGRLMERVVRKTQVNEKRQAARYATDETLEASLSTPSLIKDGLLMLAAAQLNKTLTPERTILLPL